MVDRKPDSSSEAKTFYGTVFSAELHEIRARRDARDPDPDPVIDLDPDRIQKKMDEAVLPRCELGLTGLALSGGGIRSATFNLGLLQGMAKITNEQTGKTLLPLFDYLSTVSGGGYIGSWLAGWIQNDGPAGVEAELKGKPRELICENKESSDPPQIQHLRDYSNYLTPNLGLFSIDTWSAIATYVRNAFINQLIIISAMTALLILPRLVAELSDAFRFRGDEWYLVVTPVIFMSALAMLSAMVGLSARIQNFQDDWLRWFIAPLLFLAAALLLWLPPDAVAFPWWTHIKESLKEFLPVLTRLPSAALRGAEWALAMVALNLGSLLIYRSDPQSNAARENWVVALGVWILSAVVAGFAGGVLLHLFINEFVYRHWNLQPWHVMTWGPGIALLLFVLALHLQLGMRGKYESDLNREWWASMVGWILIYGVLWTFLAAVSIFGPLLFELLKGWTKTELAVVMTWLVTVVTGVLISRSPKTGDPATPNWLDRLTKVVVPIAVIGLFVVVAIGLNAFFMWWLGTDIGPIKRLETQLSNVLTSHDVTVKVDIQHGMTGPNCCGIVSDYFSSFILPHWSDLMEVLIGAVVIVLVMGYLVDLNQFSMNSFYRNRLVRCYLRAIRKKGESNPNKVHGFDLTDDFPLADLTAVAAPPQKPYHGPYLLINAALNITDPKRLGWQERKASAFVFSPKYCGSNLTGYRKTKDYADEIRLGTALAISGAAFSSKMGYQSSRPLAFFLSLFNARLGWWIGNPRLDKYTDDGPRWGLYYLLAELLGWASDERKYIYLSDGGHFDNLGLYELIRRRCKYIVCSDAGADGQFNFKDLGMAIRKIRADFGVDIEIKLDMIKPQEGQHYSRHHVAIGIIRYDLMDENSPVGILVYIKASLIGEEPADVLEYKAHHPDFPHETTLDQFFSESQFEAYRALGENIGREVFRYAQQAL